MPTLSPTLIARLTADATVSGLIASRIYPEYARESDKTYPLAVFKVENLESQLASDGPTGLLSADYVIAAISPTYKAASQVADAIESRLNGTTWADATNAINIQGCFLKDDGRSENVVTQQDNESVNLYVTELTFQIWFNSTS